MESVLKGQFYLLSAFIVGTYLFFLMELFVSTTSNFQTPEVPSVKYIHDAIQKEVTQEGTANLVLEALKYIPEPIGVSCVSETTGDGCDLSPEEWYCGANVTVKYRGKLSVDVTHRVFSKNFHINSTRTPIYIYSNNTANLVKISTTVESNGTLLDSEGNPIKAKTQGNTITFRTNLVKYYPKVLLWYHLGESKDVLFKDIGILSDEGYTGAGLYSHLSSRDTENLTFSDLSNILNHAGPRVLFVTGEYPESYGDLLKKYVSEGGIYVGYKGLCKTSCLVGSIEQITDSHTLNATGDFTSLNPIQTNSEYFTKADESWVVYGPNLNTSRAAIGAIAYGEGYVVFVGNQSMLTTWNQMDDFLNHLINWAMPVISTTTKSCPEQTP